MKRTRAIVTAAALLFPCAVFAQSTSYPDKPVRLLSQGIAPVASTPDAFAATIRQNIARFAKVIKELGLKVE